MNRHRHYARSALAALTALALVAALVACNTMRGFGKDMENAGEAIQRAGDDD